MFFGAKFKNEVLQKALNAFYSLGISLVLLNESFVQGAREYMERFNIAIYDASFIFLAEKEAIPLITADKKHHPKKFSKRIKHLSDSLI